VVSVPRFFKRSSFRYSGAIHEQLVPVSGDEHRAATTGVRYLHSGYIIASRRKAHRNIRMLEKELAKCPDDDYYLYQLGKAHFSLKEYDAAAAAFERAVAAIHFKTGRPPLGRTGCGVAEDVLTDLIVSLAYAYVNTDRVELARRLLETHQALGHAGTQNADFPHALGYVYLMLGDVPRAKEAFAESLERGVEREQVRGTASYSSFYHLGLLSEAERDIQRALQYYARAIGQKPDYHAALSRCVDLIAEYQVGLPPELWNLADEDAFTAVYMSKFRAFLEQGATDQAGLLMNAARALSPQLFEACVRLSEQAG